MKVRFHYQRATHGPFPWSAYAIVTEALEYPQTRQIKIEVSTCSTKWGARWALRKRVRQHLSASCKVERFDEVVEVLMVVRTHYANGEPVTLRDKILEPCFMPAWWFYLSTLLAALLVTSPLIYLSLLR